jgi:hypothetical protein
MSTFRLCLLFAACCFPFTLGCKQENESAGTVAEQDELAAYVAEHGSDDSGLNNVDQ